MSADNLNVIKWWVDASYAAHDDMHRHTGANMSLGCGLVLSMSKKQKLNMKSSTEAELIGADDALPQMLWTKYFIEAQGYVADENIMYQDNLSAMLLERNRNKSSTKNTKHIQVRYFSSMNGSKPVVCVARNYIFSLILICYGPKRDIFDYWGTNIFSILSYYILLKDKGL